jgi:protein-L-isoaspartate(D-aspartate) O-methyltransferase
MANASEFLSAPRSVELRRTMVDCQLRTFDVTDTDVLDAVLETPREPFVDAPESLAYSDASLTVRGAVETRRLLAPMALARALQDVQLRKDDRALDVAGAAGYSAAVLARLVAHVTALESDEGFVAQAGRAFAELGLDNATAVRGDLAAGHPAGAPYDLIIINGAVGAPPAALLNQLADGGRLLAIEAGPGGSGAAGRFMMYERVGATVADRAMFDTTALPLAAFARKPLFAF